MARLTLAGLAACTLDLFFYAAASCALDSCRADEVAASKGVALLQTASNLGRSSADFDVNGWASEEQLLGMQIESRTDTKTKLESMPILEHQERGDKPRLKAGVRNAHHRGNGGSPWYTKGFVGCMSGATCSAFIAGFIGMLVEKSFAYKWNPAMPKVVLGAALIGGISGFGNAIEDCESLACSISVGCSLGIGNGDKNGPKKPARTVVLSRDGNLLAEISDKINSSRGRDVEKRCAAGTIGGGISTSIVATIMGSLVQIKGGSFVGITTTVGALWGLAMGFLADSVTDAFLDGFTWGLPRLLREVDAQTGSWDKKIKISDDSSVSSSARPVAGELVNVSSSTGSHKKSRPIPP